MTPRADTEFFPPPCAPRAPNVWLMTIVEDFRQLCRFWPVVQNMVTQELRVRYQRSVLGFLWTLLNPILMMATLAVVFSLFGARRTPARSGPHERRQIAPSSNSRATELPTKKPTATNDPRVTHLSALLLALLATQLVQGLAMRELDRQPVAASLVQQPE